MNQLNRTVAEIPNPPDAFQIAERMIELGGHVLYIPQGTKACTTPGWQNLAHRNLETARQLGENQRLNVLLVAKKDGLWLLDFDDLTVLEEYEQKYQKIETYRVRSVSGGIHLYFKQNDRSRMLGNFQGKDANGKETFSARIDNRYVLAPFSAAYPDNDNSRALTYYETIDLRPVIEAPDSLFDFLLEKSKHNAIVNQTASQPGESEPTKIPHGGIHDYLVREAGKLREMGLEVDLIETALLDLAHQNCQAPIDDEKVKQVARSMKNYERGVSKDLTLSQEVQDKKQPELEITTPESRPVFPYWAFEGTSLWEGLVAPTLKTSSKHAEFLITPAVQMVLNYLSGRVDLSGSKDFNLFVGLISPYGKFFKSSSCQIVFDYFRQLGCLTSFGRTVGTSDGKTIICQAGSPEGMGVLLSTAKADRAILYNDELAKLVNKAGVENSSFSSDLLSWYGSADFGNNVKSRKDSFNFEAKSYWFGWLFCTTDRSFNRQWPKLAGIANGMEDRCFFVVSPEKPKPVVPLIEPDFQKGLIRTRQLIDKAIKQQKYDFEDFQSYADAVSVFDDPRSMDLARKLCLYFAVDLGLDKIDHDCVERAVAVVQYRNQIRKFLAPIEADNQQARLQQEIVREIRQAGGKMKYRELCRLLHSDRYGQDVWRRAYQTMLVNKYEDAELYEFDEKQASGQKSKMIGILKFDD